MVKKLRSQKGFTMIELLIVGGFTAVVGVVTLINLFGWREHRQISATAQQIATMLREAESRAISQSEGAAWGVRFCNCPEGVYYTLFSSSTAGRSQVTYYQLPKSINYKDLAANEYRDIIFDQIRGRPKIYRGGVDPMTGYPEQQPPTYEGSNLSLNILVATSGEISSGSIEKRTSSTITVSDLGIITFDTFSCYITCTPATVVLPPPPTLALSATPLAIQTGESALLSWSASGASSCSATWTPSQAISGSGTVSPNLTTTYGMTCGGAGGSVTQSVTVTVTTPGGTGGGGGGGGGGPKKIR